ncbi:MAG: hypothetical protein C4529_08890 [Deltaproteobacteria bacterium]|nr:MAG: hypothetical protein C4529_08890 [Deltaproteobacteria bacterium]
MQSPDPRQGPADEPGSFVVGTDGVRRPNMDDPAMRERERLKAAIASPPEAAAVPKEDSHVS